MATIREIAPAPWRMQLVPASYAGVEFHVEQQSRNSGRRVVVHQYPKRDKPYSEDMGRQAVRYQMTGYLIGPDYHIRKEELIRVLENKEGGLLVDPYLAKSDNCICERYSVLEGRERGGYCVFEMLFVELGAPGNSLVQTDTNGNVAMKSNAAEQSAIDTTGHTVDEAQRTSSAVSPSATAFVPNNAEQKVINSGITF